MAKSAGVVLGDGPGEFHFLLHHFSLEVHLFVVSVASL